MSGLAAKLEGLARFHAAERVRAEEYAAQRTLLVNALLDSLAAQAEARRALRRETFERFKAAVRTAAQSRESRRDRAMARLGSFGQATVIERSGLWRTTGRRTHDLRHMAAYARRGPNPGVSPLAFLDQPWYLHNNPDVARSGMSPLVHYLVYGRFETRTTHPLFSVAWYVAQKPELAKTGADPVADYLSEGWRQELSPHPLFDPAWYRRQTTLEPDTPPLLHYLEGGWRLGLKPHPLFDPTWYRTRYEDVAEAGLEPLTHFVEGGAAEGRSPSPWFDLPHYVAVRGAALPEGVNPLVDYLEGGAWAVGEARPGVPTGVYLLARPEIIGEGRTPLDHWARLANPLVSL